jgi:O-antigen ligase
MFNNKIIFNIIIFLLVFGLLISDPFLQKNFPGLTQGVLVFPFLVSSFIDYKFFRNNVFIEASAFYGSIILLLFMLSGAKSINLFSNTFGTVLFGLSVFNSKYIERIFRKSAVLVIIGCSVIAISFYLGFWDIDELTRRYTFIDHNQNTLAFLMCIGVSFIFYYYHSAKNRKIKTGYLLLIAFLVVPILSTISRTGIVLLFITIFINIYFVTGLNKKIAIVLAGILIVLSSSLVLSLFETDLPYFQQFSERSTEAEQDSRIRLWSIGGKLANENLFTGVGFNNFYNDDWRRSVGLVNTGFDVNRGQAYDYSVSVHNSFLDLILIGGIFLLIPYVFIILNLCYNSFRLFKLPQKEPKVVGAFILSTVIGIILFSFTGQAATFKFTWYLFAVNYYFIYLYLKKDISAGSKNLNENFLVPEELNQYI